MIPKTVKICGIPHSVELCENNFDVDLHLGQIDYDKARIRINKDAALEIQEQSLAHEMLHGILVLIGRNDLSTDETFVQSLSNAIYQSFWLKQEGDTDE